MLYVDWYDGPSIPAAMEIAFSRGVLVFLNLESQYDKDSPLTGMLQHTCICQVSLDEPGAGEDPVKVALWLVDQGVGTPLVTMGSDGSVVAQRRGSFASCLQRCRWQIVMVPERRSRQGPYTDFEPDGPWRPAPVSPAPTPGSSAK